MLLSIVIPLLLLMLFLRKIFRDSCYSLDEKILGALAFCVSLVFIFALGAFLAISATDSLPDEECVYKMTTQAVIIFPRNYLGETERTYLLHGDLDGVPTYFYFEKNDNGYEVKTIRESDCTIKFDNENPRIESYEVKGFNHWYTYIYAWPTPRNAHSIIYVPEGTIFQGRVQYPKTAYFPDN